MRALTVAGLLVALSVARPWGAPATGRPAGDAIPPTTAGAGFLPAASASPRPSPGRDEIACPPSGWQIVSLDRMATWTVRTWTPASPVRANGPLDVAIPEVSLESPAVLALGMCAPAVARTDLPMTGVPIRIAAAWQRDGVRLRPLDLEAVGVTRDDLALAVLYRPARWGSLVRSWPPGHFVLELALPQGVDPSRDARLPVSALEPGAWFMSLSVPGPG